MYVDNTHAHTFSVHRHYQPLQPLQSDDHKVFHLYNSFVCSISPSFFLVIFHMFFYFPYAIARSIKLHWNRSSVQIPVILWWFFFFAYEYDSLCFYQVSQVGCQALFIYIFPFLSSLLHSAFKHWSVFIFGSLKACNTPMSAYSDDWL